MVWLTAIVAFGTLCLTVAAFFQYLTAREQSSAAREQAGTAREQAALMQRQLNTMNEQAKSMEEQTNSLKESVAHQKESIGQTGTLIKQQQEALSYGQRSTRAAEHGVDLAAQSMRYGDAAYVGIATVAMDTVGEKIRARLKIINSGNTPADNVVSYCHLTVRNRPLPLFTLADAKKDIEDERASRTQIPPNGGVIFQDLFSATRLSEKVSRLLNESDDRVFVWGMVTYDDVFGRRRWTKFCFEQVAGSRDLENCSNNNEAN